MNELNADVLEVAAMAKTYNDSIPDDIIVSSLDEPKELSSPLAKISKWISKISGTKDDRSSTIDFRYIELTEYDWSCRHIVFNDRSFLLSSDYIIDYSASKDNDIHYGKLSFKKDYDLSLEYWFLPSKLFFHEMEEMEWSIDLLDKFEYDCKSFFEFENGIIYMHDGKYMWKISVDRDNTQEYNSIYLMLKSISSSINSSTIKSAYTMSNQLDEKDMKDITDSIDNNQYVEVLDSLYYISRRTENYSTAQPIQIYKDESWKFKGTFQAGILGNYNSGEILEYSEIADSEDLSDKEKIELFETILEQRQISISSIRDDLIDSLFLIIFKDIHKKLSFQHFKNARFVDFIKIETLEDKSERGIYEFIRQDIDSYSLDDLNALQNGEADEALVKVWKKTLSYIDLSAFTNIMMTVSIKVSPDFVILICGIFGRYKYFVITEDNRLIEWE